MSLTLYTCLCLGDGGEAGRHGAGGSGHGAVSSRSGAASPSRHVAVSAAESSQSAADLNYPPVLRSCLLRQHNSNPCDQLRFHFRAKTRQTRRYF